MIYRVIECSNGGALWRVVRDGTPVWKLRCPGCGEWADIDDDQFHGRASVDHTVATARSDDENMNEGRIEVDGTVERGCGYHETYDWSQEVSDGA